MAKSKWVPRKGAGLLNRMLSKTKPAKDDRLATLAVELGIAGAQVLQEDFGFTLGMSATWLDKMLDRAKVNRGASLAMMAVKEIDGESQNNS
jgi:hypothetical protein